MIDLGGRPLLDYTLAVADRITQLARLVLSTNMPDAIDWTRSHYPRIEIPFVRPERLSESSSTPGDVVLHCIDYLQEADGHQISSVVLLQPTCPFRLVAEVEEAVNVFLTEKMDSLVGVSRVWHHPSDYVYREQVRSSKFLYVFRESGWSQRQHFPEVLFMTGALYICRVDYLRQTQSFYDQNSRLFEMSDETMIDIDSPFDLEIARGLVSIGSVRSDLGEASSN